MSLPDATVNKNLQGRGVRASVQRFGGFLAGMIMPNIGAFIAWGLITALFIKTGWLPNARLATLVDPMIMYLLPILIGYTGGKIIHGQRGAVIGAIATMGVVVGADIPMFLGAMVMGPLAAWLLKQLDRLLVGRVKAGFEMLVDNFEIGILGLLLAIAGNLGIEPVVTVLMNAMASGVNFLVRHGLLPLASLFIEPAKVLFLNNAVNHGILTPLGLEQARATGRSILFMVESNPGPGLGLLLAYQFFGTKKVRDSVPGAIVIHLFGGIHEIFFPYVLMKPKTILATIAGGMSGVAVGVMLNAGLVAPASPGSIIAWFAVCAKGHYVAMILDFLVATAVSFVVASLLIRPDRRKDEQDEAVTAAELSTPSAVVGEGSGKIERVVVACDAGMGSSVMVASTMKKRLTPYGVEVTHTPVDHIPPDADLVLTQEGLVDRARKRAPRARIVAFTNYMNDPAFDQVEEAVKSSAPERDDRAPEDTGMNATQATFGSGVLSKDGIVLGLRARDRDDAIRQSGQLLVDLGAADPQYIDGMLEREQQISTYMGEGLAIPHGVNESRQHIRRAALGFLQFPEGVEWNGNTCYMAVPIASSTDEHLEIMAALARVLADPSTAQQLRTVTTAEQVLNLLNQTTTSDQEEK